MKLHELLQKFNFKGTVTVYHFDDETDKSVDYIKRIWIEDLLWMGDESETEISLYRNVLKDKEVKYFSIHLYDYALELWICIEKL